MRRYLHYREHEIAKAFARLEEELREKRFLDEEFSSKGCRHGFKSARDWIEKLIFAEEMLEASPRDTLCYLAKAYGLEPDFYRQTRARPMPARENRFVVRRIAAFARTF